MVSGRVSSAQFDGAALEQRRAQPLLVDPELLGELEALVVGRDARPQDQVVHHLADLPGPQVAEVEDAAGEAFERRPACLESLRIAADHHQELAGLGRRLAAGERHVQQNDAAVRQTRGEPRHRARRDGRGDADDQPGTRGGRDAARRQQHRFGLLVEADHDDDEIALLVRPRAGSAASAIPERSGLPARDVIDVVAGHLESGFAQMAGHRVAPSCPAR